MARAILGPVLTVVGVLGTACDSGRALQKPSAPDPNERPALLLERVLATPVPDSFPASGVALDDAGTPVVWSTNSSAVLVIDGGFHHLLQSDAVRPIGLHVKGRGEGRSVQIFDAAPSPRIITLQPDAVSIRLAPLTGEPTVAVHSGSTWFVSEEVEHGARLSALSDDGAYRILGTLRGGAGSGVQLHPWTSGVVLVTEIRHPFQTSAIDLIGDTILKFQPVPELGMTESGVALPMLPVPPGFVQVISDLRGDRRVIVTFDGLGGVLRVKETYGLLGLTTSGVQGGLVAGVQDLGGQEVVAFRWRWLEPGQP